jgi:hypothetical protein
MNLKHQAWSWQDSNMRIGNSFRLARVALFTTTAVGAAPALFAATPSFTITATNVTVSGQGSGSSAFTIDSVNGFAGTVSVTCSGPDTNTLPDLVLPSCNHPTQLVDISANGSASGTIGFYPPWTDGYESTSLKMPAKPMRRSPLIACVVAGFMMAGWRFRRKLRQRSDLILVATCIALLAGLTGCLGTGGLAMTPGTYSYAITGNSSSETQNATISVTVQCNSCP